MNFQILEITPPESLYEHTLLGVLGGRLLGKVGCKDISNRAKYYKYHDSYKPPCDLKVSIDCDEYLKLSN